MQMTKRAEFQVHIEDPFARRLVVKYLGHRKTDIENLRRALADADYDSIRDKGHNLFGSGSAYGLERVSELGAMLEKAATNRQSRAVAEIIDELETYVQTVTIA